MNEDKYFYLDRIFPETDKVFGFDFKGLAEIKEQAIFAFDTNVLLVPYLTGKETIEDYKRIFSLLKEQNRLFIPARVAREFANNRGENLATVFKRIHEALDRLNRSDFTLGDYPVLETNEDYQNAQELEKQINVLKSEYRNILEKITLHVKQWNWNDPISKLYKDLFTTDIIVECKKDREEIIKDLNFRIENRIAPGFKDEKKADNGIGDLIIWQTILEIGKEKKQDLIFVTNEKKNDWFHIQERTALYPKYELYDEFRRFTDGHSIAIISFVEFLSLQEAKGDTIKQVIEQAVSQEESDDLRDKIKQIIHTKFRKDVEGLLAPSGYTIIDKESFLNHLSRCELQIAGKENGFVGSKFFIETFLAERGFDIGNSWEKFHELEQEGIIESYIHEDKYGSFPPIRAVRRTK
jgi:hypothetical protein